MSLADHRVEAELQKLAHQLGVGTDRLAFLAAVPHEDLRTLRGQISSALFEADRAVFAKVAGLARTIPGALAAKVTEFALSPLIAARTAELLEPQRAIDLIGRLSEGYLADVAAVLDAPRCPQLIAALPPEAVAKVAAELARRGEWVVIGGFTAHVSLPALAAAVSGYTGEQLLRISFVLDDQSRVDTIVELLTADQADQLLGAAAENGLWAELDELAGRLEPQRRQRLAARLAAAPAAVREAVSAAAADGRLGPETHAALTSA